VERIPTFGNDSLEGAGLVVFTRCGHWWVYPVRRSPEQMHQLAQFNLGIACSFCHAARQDTTHARPRGTATRQN
jgi:hypothetical protein